MNPATFDASLKHPSTWIVSGGTGSGKSFFTRRLIEDRERIFSSNTPKAVLLFYKQWQPLYTEMKNNGLISEFYEGIPEEEDLKEMFKRYKHDGGCIAIFDDLQGDVNSTITNCFTVYSHHMNVTIILLVQSLFLESKLYHTCSLNSHYIVLMKNNRDGASVSYLARQISPYHSKYITESYMKATKNPYSYLLFDMRQETNDMLRLRSNIFSSPISIFVESDNKKKKR